MSVPFPSFLAPRCASCTRRFANLALYELRPRQQQVRGKKKLARDTTSTTLVRLLKDVPAFGRKGSIVPLSTGMMRNRFFPQGAAVYLSFPELKDIKSQNTRIERDFEFGADLPKGKKGRKAIPEPPEEPIEEVPEVIPAAPVEVERITPERSVELLQILLPHRLDFHRQPIELAAPVEPSESRDLPREKRDRQQGVSSAASDLLAARSTGAAPAQPQHTGPRAIFGSVSSGDVTAAMRAALADNEEASKVVVEEDEIRFVNVRIGDNERARETDRVKFLGEYQVEIRIRGTEEPIKRIVRILAQQT